MTANNISASRTERCSMTIWCWGTVSETGTSARRSCRQARSVTLEHSAVGAQCARASEVCAGPPTGFWGSQHRSCAGLTTGAPPGASWPISRMWHREERVCKWCDVLSKAQSTPSGAVDVTKQGSRFFRPKFSMVRLTKIWGRTCATSRSPQKVSATPCGSTTDTH